MIALCHFPETHAANLKKQRNRIFPHILNGKMSRHFPPNFDRLPVFGHPNLLVAGGEWLDAGESLREFTVNMLRTPKHFVAFAVRLTVLTCTLISFTFSLLPFALACSLQACSRARAGALRVARRRQSWS
jgi:hypothetical protein